MDRFFFHLVCRVVLSCVTASVASMIDIRSAYSQSGHPDFEATLVSDRNVYRLDQKMRITFYITNHSSKVRYVFAPFNWGETGSVSLWAYDTLSGKPLEKTFIADAPLPPPRSRDALVRLPSGHIYGVTSEFTADELGITSDGVYEVKAVFHSPLPPTMNFGLPIWSSQDGNVESNRLRIRIEK